MTNLQRKRDELKKREWWQSSFYQPKCVLMLGTSFVQKAEVAYLLACSLEKKIAKVLC